MSTKEKVSKRRSRMLRSTIKRLCRRNYLIPAGFFVFGLLFFNLPQIIGFTSNLYSSVTGDHTAGFIWLNTFDGNTPFWTHSNVSDYPFGESLWQPNFIFGELMFLPAWLFTKLVGNAIGGYKLLLVLGFAVSFFLAYFYLLKRLRLSTLYASVGAFFIAFSPYVLTKVVQPSYVFMPGLLLGILYLGENVWIKKGAKPVVLLGVVLGLTPYFDPYLPLFCAIMLGTYYLLQGIIGLHSRSREFSTNVLRVVTAAVIAFIFFAPGVFYLKMHSSYVSLIEQRTRGDIVQDAKIYSAQPSDYVSPAEKNPLYSHQFRALKDRTRTVGETYWLFLGYSLILVSIAGCISFVISIRRGTVNESQKLTGNYLAIALVAFSVSLPAVILIGGHNIRMPSYYLAVYTGIWRSFSRLYVVLQPMLVIISILFLYKLKVKRFRLANLLLILFVSVLFVEYLTRPITMYFTSYSSINHSLPQGYAVIKDNESIGSLADYPMLLSPDGLQYFSYQLYHKKPLFNSYTIASNQRYLDNSLVDLNNRQTWQTLSTLGIDAIHVVDNNPFDVPTYAKQIYAGSYQGKDDKVYLIGQVTPTRFVAVASNDFRPRESTNPLTDIQYPVDHIAHMQILDLCMYKNQVRLRLTCDSVTPPGLVLHTKITQTANFSQSYTIYQDGKTIAKGILGPHEERTISVPLSGTDDLKIETGDPLKGVIHLSDFYITP